MQPKTAKWLNDILKSCDLILEHTSQRTRADYEADRFLRSGVERNFEIIGEVLLRIERSEPSVAAHIPNCRQIIGFRNILAHGYDIVDHARVWAIIQDELPPLRDRIAALVEEIDQDSDEGHDV